MTTETQTLTTTKPKPFVFVLMPFRAEYDDLYELVACPGNYFSADTALEIGISPTNRPC